MKNASSSHRVALHFLGGSPRFRAEGARLAFALGCHAEVYETLEEFLHSPPRSGLILACDDPELDGMAVVMKRLGEVGIWLPLVAVHAELQVERAVAAIKAGAVDYVALPLDAARLTDLVASAAEEQETHADARRRMVVARSRIDGLSPREREVLDRLAEGNSNKAIAQFLRISPRTVEIHRASMMRKLGAKHAAEAVRVRLEAGMEEDQRRSG